MSYHIRTKTLTQPVFIWTNDWIFHWMQKQMKWWNHSYECPLQLIPEYQVHQRCSPRGSCLASRQFFCLSWSQRCLGTRQPAASVLNQVPWPRLRLIIFGSGSVSKFPPRSCLDRHGSGRLDLHVPVDYDTIQYKTRQHQMFWLASICYDVVLMMWTCKDVSLCFCNFRPQSPSALPRPSAGCFGPGLTSFLAFTASASPRQFCLDPCIFLKMPWLHHWCTLLLL